MRSGSHTLWFSLLHKRPYAGIEPNYPDLAEIKGIRELEENYKIILSELRNYLKHFSLESHFNITMVEKPKSWKVRALRVWGVEMYKVQSYFPETLRLMANVDGVTSIGFNLLEPHAKIKLHSGDTNAIIRCHLGLVIPEESDNCAIRVNNESKYWKEGKVIGFTDAYQHEAWNTTETERIIFLFDILKPEYSRAKNKICGTVLASFYLQQLANVFPKLYNLNPLWLYPVSYPLAFFIRVLIPLRNKVLKN